ncbi:MAG: T9SS type A sorting domain-containing protein [Saprospiraceae bacterium]|nr:T9SS type A sorting domain-containing protein [Saprospiraceae bacterium]
MKTTIQPSAAALSFEQKLKEYTKLTKAVVQNQLKKPQSLLPLGAAFLASVPNADAVIIYSGGQNISCALAGNTNRCYANINQAGGNDFEFHRNHVGAQIFIQVDEFNGGGFSINGFHAQVVGAYAYPYANSSGVNIGAGGPWGFNAGQANSLSDNGFYPNHKWEGLPNGTTRFLGIRGTMGGNTHYGWIRLTKNSFGNYTIVDWAFENTPNTPILTGATAAVNLVDFDGRLKADEMHLTWRTAGESNNAGFEVERSEDGGKTFHYIAWVDGHGSTTDFKDYFYDDKNLREGKTYYYRLRQIDHSGEFHFSPIVSATLFGDGPVVSEFYPNPSAAGMVNIDFAAKQDGEWTAVAYDVAGKEMRREKVAVVEGVNALQFDFSGLGSGLFFIKMENGQEKLYRKLTIE